MSGEVEASAAVAVVVTVATARVVTDAVMPVRVARRVVPLASSLPSCKFWDPTKFYSVVAYLLTLTYQPRWIRSWPWWPW